MEAGILDRVDGSVDVEQCDVFARDRDDGALSHGELVEARGFHKFSHVAPLFPSLSELKLLGQEGTPRLLACIPAATQILSTSMISSMVAPSFRADWMCRRVPGAYM